MDFNFNLVLIEFIERENVDADVHVDDICLSIFVDNIYMFKKIYFVCHLPFILNVSI